MRPNNPFSVFLVSEGFGKNHGDTETRNSTENSRETPCLGASVVQYILIFAVMIDLQNIPTRNRIANFLLLIVLCVAFVQCKNKKEKVQYVDQDIRVMPMGEYELSPGAIKKGTPVQIIAYSGGRPNTEDEAYYHQFIVVDRNSGDTFRVLSTMLTTSTGELNRVYSEVAMYDAGKGIVEATYYPVDSSMKDVMSLVAEGMENDKTMPNLKQMMGDSSKQRFFILTNPNIPALLPKYTTMMGVLDFSEPPWNTN